VANSLTRRNFLDHVACHKRRSTYYDNLYWRLKKIAEGNALYRDSIHTKEAQRYRAELTAQKELIEAKFASLIEALEQGYHRLLTSQQRLLTQ
jgi:hypothetical protein